MSLLKPSDFEDWKRLSVSAVIAIVIVSLAWAFFGSFFSQLGKNAAQALHQTKEPAVAQNAQHNVQRQPSGGTADKEDDINKETPTEDQGFGGIFNSLGSAKK